jgi:hypothetical protein
LHYTGDTYLEDKANENFVVNTAFADKSSAVVTDKNLIDELNVAMWQAQGIN